MSDYEEQTETFNRIRHTAINATRRVVCYDQPIYDDQRLEEIEYIGLGVALRDHVTEARPLYDNSVIYILDDDGKQ